MIEDPDHARPLLEKRKRAGRQHKPRSCLALTRIAHKIGYHGKKLNVGLCFLSSGRGISHARCRLCCDRALRRRNQRFLSDFEHGSALPLSLSGFSDGRLCFSVFLNRFELLKLPADPPGQIPVGIGACQLKMDPPTTDGDARGDFEKFQTDLAERRLFQLGAFEHTALEDRKHQMSESRKPQPQLI